MLLADDLVEGARAHPHGQRRGRIDVGDGRCGLLRLEEGHPASGSDEVVASSLGRPAATGAGLAGSRAVDGCLRSVGMQVLRYTAFATTPEGGNPAGVVLDAGGAAPSEMLAVAADVGYSETAFLTEADGQLTVRYFSPLAEVPFCGHATIAAAVAWADQNRAGPPGVPHARRPGGGPDPSRGRDHGGDAHQRAADGSTRSIRSTWASCSPR